jgi:hypothetical protein
MPPSIAASVGERDHAATQGRNRGKPVKETEAIIEPLELDKAIEAPREAP